MSTRKKFKGELETVKNLLQEKDELIENLRKKVPTCNENSGDIKEPNSDALMLKFQLDEEREEKTKLESLKLPKALT